MPLTLVPPPPLRVTEPGDPPGNAVRAFLGQLTSAKLSLFTPIPLTSTVQRIPAEADAGARAAACPDLFVIHAPDPASRERVIADIVASCPDDRTLALTTDSTGRRPAG